MLTIMPSVFFQAHLRYALGRLLSNIEKQIWILITIFPSSLRFPFSVFSVLVRYLIQLCKKKFSSNFFVVREVST